jgi:hypothetical protein
MTEKIRTLGPGSLTIGATDSAQKFDADLTKAALTPKSDPDDSTTFLDGSEESGSLSVAWTLDGTIKEDYSTTGLQAFCFNNSGKTMPFVFIPNTEAELGFEGSVLVTPVGIGGDVKKKNDQDFSFTATNVKIKTNTVEG